MICAILIVIFGKLSDFEWALKNWHLVALFAVSFSIPYGCTLLIRQAKINKNSINFYYFPALKNMREAAKNIDTLWNQNVFISEIKDIEIVKLTEEEKQTKVYYKHWFNKYLKINLKDGNPKYVYVGNYSNNQIKKIIKLARINTN